MFDLLRARITQGHRTQPLPKGGAELPERFRGRPRLDPDRCVEGCRACIEACPTGAIAANPLTLDLSRCLFCPACTEACPEGAIAFTREPALAVGDRRDLLLRGEELRLAQALGEASRRVLGRSLKLRQVSAGGCSGCEVELTALSNVVFDLARFGVQFVASPRHADGVVITGPVTANMVRALRETHAAVPPPKIVVAVGACALSGGPFAGAEDSLNGVPEDLPVDLFIPGCPPHPWTILDGLLRLLGRRG